MNTTGFLRRSWQFLKSKKYILLFLLIACILVYFAGVWIVEEYSYHTSGMWEWEVKDFSDNKPHFERLAHDLYRYFEEEYENNDQLQSIQTQTMGEEWELMYSYSGTTDTKTERVSMTEAERESLEKVQSALYHEQTGLYYIDIHAERVTFANAYGYAVIWSQNGERPTFLSSPDEKGEFYSNRLSFFSNTWYQCIRK